jgi:hypothetical protein
VRSPCLRYANLSSIQCVHAASVKGVISLLKTRHRILRSTVAATKVGKHGRYFCGLTEAMPHFHHPAGVTGNRLRWWYSDRSGVLLTDNHSISTSMSALKIVFLLEIRTQTYHDKERCPSVQIFMVTWITDTFRIPFSYCLF